MTKYKYLSVIMKEKKHNKYVSILWDNIEGKKHTRNHVHFLDKILITLISTLSKIGASFVVNHGACAR